MRALVPDPTVSFTPAISICLPISIPVQRLLCFHTFAVYDAFWLLLLILLNSLWIDFGFQLEDKSPIKKHSQFTFWGYCVDVVD